MQNSLVVLAGATGNLGGRIASALIARGATVRAIVRPGSAPHRVEALRQQGVVIASVGFDDASALANACSGAACVVSALSGLREVIVDAQTQLLNATVRAGVQRFIPSDYCIDFTRLTPGSNRNLDLRREFQQRLDAAPIAATSILNGAFTDMLTGQAPIVLFRFRRVLYWENADQRMDFTSIDDTAAFTAAAALDASTPRFFRIAGDQVSARELAAVATETSGTPYALFRAGSLGRLARIIAVARRLFPAPDALYPPWQGMQYLHNMFEGRAKLSSLDNERYPGMRWTTTRDVLVEHFAGGTAESVA